MSIFTVIVEFDIETTTYERALVHASEWADAINNSEPFDPLPLGTVSVLAAYHGTEDDTTNEGPWGTSDYNEFAEQLENAGYEVDKYEGRGYYKGPSVKCANERVMSEVLAATTVPCRWDNMGLGYVVYPR